MTQTNLGQARACSTWALVLLLSACGGGGGSSSTSSGSGAAPVTTLGGTVAVGDPITGATVNVKCAAGPTLTATATDSQGSWSMDVANQTLPCVVQSSGGFVNSTANSTQYHSIALATGTTNVTPITDLMVAHWVQNANLGNWFTSITPASIAALDHSTRAAVLSRIRNAVPLINALQSNDPITTSFTPTAGNAMDDMLEALKNARTAHGSTHADDLTMVTQGNTITVTSGFYTALVWKYRSTTSGGTASGVNYAASSVVTSAPTETYTAASEEENAFNLLNAERSRCGFGYLTQNTLVDAAARSHADWQLINWINSHYESSGTTGYTGYNGGNRIQYQGYTNLLGYGDNIGMRTGTNSKTGYGVESIRGLLSAPFHSRSLLGYFRDVGFGVRNNVDAGSANFGVVSQINLAYSSTGGKQQPASEEVITYPCQGTTGVNYRLRNESPNPVPGRDLSTNPLGHPVVIRVHDNNSLSVTSVTMTSTSTNVGVTLRSVAQTRADDTNHFFTYNEAYVIPDAPLAQNTTYRVTIIGTNASVPFSKTFTFTTGTGG